MSLVHVHLMLNHLPVIGAVFVAALLAAAVYRRSAELTRVALAFVALLGVTSVVVFLTGEPAEELVERLPGVSESIMERHEEVALVATIVMSSAAALALIVLAVFRNRLFPRWIASSSLVAALGLTAIMGYTANLGGQIRHSEIRATQSPTLGESEDDSQEP